MIKNIVIIAIIVALSLAMTAAAFAGGTTVSPEDAETKTYTKKCRGSCNFKN